MALIPRSAGVAARAAVGLESARAADCFSVAGTARFRVTQRRRLLDSARQGMVLVVAAAVLNGVSLFFLHPDSFAHVVGLNAAIGFVAISAYLLITRRARHNPEAPVFAVLVVIDVATIALGLLDPRMGFIAVGYLLLLPTIVALMVPWATRTHTGWVLWHLVACIGYAALAPAASLPGTRGDLLTLLIVATVVSQFGHVGLLRARVLSYLQISNIQAINRQAQRDEVRLQHITDSVEKTARTDELTRLGNRLSLRLALVAARARIARYRERFAILMMDLDRFKAINDDLGHLAGDDVLQRSAALLSASVRPEDGVYRFGGEEFVAIMRIRDPVEAVRAAERLRNALEGLDLSNPGNPPSGVVTISIGIAVVGPDDLGTEDDEWLVRADAALYRAKANGGNRCELEILPSHQPAPPDGAGEGHHEEQVAGLTPPRPLAPKV